MSVLYCRFFLSAHKYFLSIYYVPSIVLGSGDTAVSREKPLSFYCRGPGGDMKIHGMSAGDKGDSDF